MKCGDQSGELLFLDVLKLVDEECQRRCAGFRGSTDGFEKRLQVMFEIAVIRQSGLGLEVDADLDVVEFDFQAADEAGKGTKCTLRVRLCLLIARESKERLS